MNTEIKDFVKRFSSKKDAMEALKNTRRTLGRILDVVCESQRDVIEIEIEYIDRDIEAVEKYNDDDLAKTVMEYFNQVNGTHYSALIKIKAIISQMPKVTFEQFQSVILHKAQTWGNDPVMRPYIRPATLFGSKNKFINYLEDATEYWIEKQKGRVKGEI